MTNTTLQKIVSLTRPGVVAMVLFTMAVAAWTILPQPPERMRLIHALVGTGGVIVGAIALNQRLEGRVDQKMARTYDRPLPSGHWTARQATWFAIVASAAGFLYLALWSSWTVLALAALSWTVYVAAYTPLKGRSLWQTPVGAVAGAMPMLLGAAVVQSPLSERAVTLFGVVYLWQFPHAMAIAWLYRQQYSAARVRLATVVDPSGRLAGRWALIGAVLLVPVSLAPLWLQWADWWYGLVAGSLGIAFVACSVHFWWCRDDRSARRLRNMSLVYLPLLFAALLIWRIG